MGIVNLLKRGIDNYKLRKGRVCALVSHRRPYDFDEKTGLWLYKKVDDDDIVWNVNTTAGRDLIHSNVYGTSPTNGFNYIALSNDTVTETSVSTTLSNEITTNGLARAQGTFTYNSGIDLITSFIDHTFTCTGAQSAQKTALFSAPSGGTMNHVLAFTAQRSLVTNDHLYIAFTIVCS